MPSSSRPDLGAREPWINLRVGMRVCSVSGVPFGVVGAVGRTAFRLDGTARRAWILRDAIFTVDERVNLVCERQGLAQFVDLDFRPARPELRRASSGE